MPYKGQSAFLVSQLEMYQELFTKYPRLIDVLISIVDDLKELFRHNDLLLLDHGTGMFLLRKTTNGKYENPLLNVPIPFGVGTSSPQGSMNIVGPSGDYPSVLYHDVYSANATDSAVISGRRSRGRYEVPAVVAVDDALLVIKAEALADTTGFPTTPVTWSETSSVLFEADGSPSAGRVSGRIVFKTRSGGTYAVRLTIISTGHLMMPELSTPATPPANNVYFYAKDKAGVSNLYFMDDAGVEHDLGGGTGSGTLTWTRYRKDYNDLAAAALTNDIELFSLPERTVIHAVKIKHIQAFAGGAITDYDVSVGIAGNLTKYHTGFDVDSAVSDTNFDVQDIVDAENEGASTSIRLAATSVGANLDQATDGVVDVWVLTSITEEAPPLGSWSTGFYSFPMSMTLM